MLLKPSYKDSKKSTRFNLHYYTYEHTYAHSVALYIVKDDKKDEGVSHLRSFMTQNTTLEIIPV